MNEPGELEYAWSIAEARDERICQLLEELLVIRARMAKQEEALENADAIFSALETERPVFAYDWGVGRSRTLIRAALKGNGEGK
jgi:ornithine cyclodeaminase/alanine dehydrogenase-like protein (mu-crystallin family)